MFETSKVIVEHLQKGKAKKEFDIINMNEKERIAYDEYQR
jgi:hypothetical protein